MGFIDSYKKSLEDIYEKLLDYCSNNNFKIIDRQTFGQICKEVYENNPNTVYKKNLVELTNILLKECLYIINNTVEEKEQETKEEISEKKQTIINTLLPLRENISFDFENVYSISIKNILIDDIPFINESNNKLIFNYTIDNDNEEYTGEVEIQKRNYENIYDLVEELNICMTLKSKEKYPPTFIVKIKKGKIIIIREKGKLNLLNTPLLKLLGIENDLEFKKEFTGEYNLSVKKYIYLSCPQLNNIYHKKELKWLHIYNKKDFKEIKISFEDLRDFKSLDLKLSDNGVDFINFQKPPLVHFEIVMLSE